MIRWFAYGFQSFYELFVSSIFGDLITAGLADTLFDPFDTVLSAILAYWS